MATSNPDRLIVTFRHSDVDCRKFSDIPHHQCNSSSSSNFVSPIQVSSSTGDFKVDNGEDNPKTPRSVEHRIPVPATCPPAPKKPKWAPTTAKRKTSCFPVVRVAADFMVYLDAMLALNETVYVPDVVVGDFDAGDHKRLKI